MNAPTPSSPCTKICKVDPNTALCLGCGRTVDEISSWWRMSEAERVRLMAQLPVRMAAAQTNS